MMSGFNDRHGYGHSGSGRAADGRSTATPRGGARSAASQDSVKGSGMGTVDASVAYTITHSQKYPRDPYAQQGPEGGLGT